MISVKTIDSFERITKFDLRSFSQSYVDFINSDKDRIKGYYYGNRSKDSGAFDNLTLLKTEIKKIISLLDENKKLIHQYEAWELLDFAESVRLDLDVIEDYKLFLRKNSYKTKYQNKVEGNFSLGANQTMESLLESELDSTDSQNDWVGVALRNELIEEDYTEEGGVLLKTTFKKDINVFQIEDVLGSLQGEEINGKDIKKTLTFLNHDLEVLTPQDTISQAADIGISLKRGDNEEFPDLGINQSAIVGTNKNTLNYPIIFRQIANVFEEDDTFSSVTLKEVVFTEDKFYLEFELRTKYGDIFNKNLNL